jgi:hypothetical protein
VGVDARLGRNSGRIWNGRPIPRGVNLQQISDEIQDTLKWGSMSLIRSDVRHSEALPEFRSHQRTCVGVKTRRKSALLRTFLKPRINP